MPVYACSVCGAVSGARRCPKHGGDRPKAQGWSRNRDRSKQATFRRDVLARDGQRCTARLPDGSRCPVTWDLRAHHLIPLSNYELGDVNAYDASRGITLCAEHDRGVDRRAR